MTDNENNSDNNDRTWRAKAKKIFVGIFSVGFLSLVLAFIGIWIGKQQLDDQIEQGFSQNIANEVNNHAQNDLIKLEETQNAILREFLESNDLEQRTEIMATNTVIEVTRLTLLATLTPGADIEGIILATPIISVPSQTPTPLESSTPTSTLEPSITPSHTATPTETLIPTSTPEPLQNLVVDGAIEKILRPSTVKVGQLENNNSIFIFQEVNNLRLPNAILVNATQPKLYTGRGDLFLDWIDEGTVINSYLIHLDPIRDTDVELGGTITFPDEILGVIVLHQELRDSDPIITAAISTDYPSPEYVDRRLELDGASDRFSISENRRVLTLELTASSGIDQIRVITAGSE